MDKNIFYVYFHHSIDGDIVYVGMGSFDRAWHIRQRTYNVAHRQWIDEQYNNDRLPSDYVSIEARGLSHTDAIELEKVLINSLGPKFNCQASWASKKYSDEDVLKWAKLHWEEGKTYKQISKITDVNTMVIFRALTGRTKAYAGTISKYLSTSNS